MNIISITTLDDPQVAAFARLTEAQLRNKLEPEKGIFIAESPKVIRRALDGGMQPLSFLMEKKWLHHPDVTVLLDRLGDMPVYTGESGVLSHLTGFELTRGVLCAMRRPVLPTVEEVLAGSHRVAVIDGVVDHTNVGAIFRSAAALGIDAVLVTSTCCDPLYRRSVRVSMGAVFQVPWTRFDERAEAWHKSGIDLLHREGFEVAAMALKDDSLSLADPLLERCEKLALVFGTEGQGLSDRVIDACDMTVRIPMQHGVDSLNVAASSAVAFWQVCRPSR